MQSAPRSLGQRLRRVQAVLVDDDELAGPDVALEVGADQVERAGLGGDDPVVAEPAERERPEPVRVAEGDERAVGERDDRVGALEPRHRRRRRPRGSGDGSCAMQRRDHLGVGGRAEPDARRRRARRAAPPAFVRLPLWPSATVRARPCWTSGCAFAQCVDAGRRVARVADRDLARKACELLLVEDLRDEAHVAQHGQPACVGDGDAGRLLAAVLEREERRSR